MGIGSRGIATAALATSMLAGCGTQPANYNPHSRDVGGAAVTGATVAAGAKVLGATHFGAAGVLAAGVYYLGRAFTNKDCEVAYRTIQQNHVGNDGSQVGGGGIQTTTSSCNYSTNLPPGSAFLSADKKAYTVIGEYATLDARNNSLTRNPVVRDGATSSTYLVVYTQYKDGKTGELDAKPTAELIPFQIPNKPYVDPRALEQYAQKPQLTWRNWQCGVPGLNLTCSPQLRQ